MLGDEHLRERQCPLDSAEEELFRRPVDRVNFVRRFRGGQAASAVNFEKGNYVVVKGSIDEVMRMLADG